MVFLVKSFKLIQQFRRERDRKKERDWVGVRVLRVTYIFKLHYKSITSGRDIFRIKKISSTKMLYITNKVLCGIKFLFILWKSPCRSRYTTHSQDLLFPQLFIIYVFYKYDLYFLVLTLVYLEPEQKDLLYLSTSFCYDSNIVTLVLSTWCFISIKILLNPPPSRSTTIQ